MKQRGEVWWINFDPSVGQDIKKKRPAIIIRITHLTVFSFICENHPEHPLIKNGQDQHQQK